jgi:hypothetical protein
MQGCNDASERGVTHASKQSTAFWTSLEKLVVDQQTAAAANQPHMACTFVEHVL